MIAQLAGDGELQAGVIKRGPGGQTLLTRARQVLAAQRGQASGTVRLAVVSPAMARHFVIPALPQLAEQHSALRLELHAEDRFVDLVAEGFDIALRTNDVRPAGWARTTSSRCRRPFTAVCC
ncbi:MAG: LysR substrate-binding domain-containing protein [Leptothrix sp. (in: b-proteobacteria)]